MSYRTNALYLPTAHDHAPRPRKYTAPKFIGAAVLALVASGALAGGWALYANRSAAAVETVVAVEPAAPVLPAAEPVPLFDVAFLHADFPVALPSERFSQREPLQSALQPGPAAFRTDDSVAKNTTPLAPPAITLVQSVPLPVPRPAELRALQSRPPSLEAIAQRTKIRTASIAERAFGQLFGTAPDAGSALSYASTDGGVLGNGQSLTSGRLPADDGLTAVYDISARIVYMPDGTKLEAHSGLGNRLDDPHHVHEKMRGATPPHVYELVPREALFHGVPALRLIPVGGEGAIFGRTGLLAHTYMLGPNGDSNGCVSFKDYDAFLRAYQHDKVKRLAVVSRLDGPKSYAQRGD